MKLACEIKAEALELLVGSGGRNILHRPQGHNNLAKGFGDSKPIPALELPVARVLDVNGHERKTRFLGQKREAGAHLVHGSARTVRSDDDIATLLELCLQLPERLTTAL